MVRIENLDMYHRFEHLSYLGIRLLLIYSFESFLQETTLNHVKTAWLLGDEFSSTPKMCKRYLIWVVTTMQVMMDLCSTRYSPNTWGMIICKMNDQELIRKGGFMNTTQLCSKYINWINKGPTWFSSVGCWPVFIVLHQKINHRNKTCRF